MLMVSEGTLEGIHKEICAGWLSGKREIGGMAELAGIQGKFDPFCKANNIKQDDIT